MQAPRLDLLTLSQTEDKLSSIQERGFCQASREHSFALPLAVANLSALGAVAALFGKREEYRADTEMQGRVRFAQAAEM